MEKHAKTKADTAQLDFPVSVCIPLSSVGYQYSYLPSMEWIGGFVGHLKATKFMHSSWCLKQGVYVVVQL